MQQKYRCLCSYHWQHKTFTSSKDFPPAWGYHSSTTIYRLGGGGGEGLNRNMELSGPRGWPALSSPWNLVTLTATNLLVFHIHISSESVFTQCNWFKLLLWAFGKKPDTGCWACWSSVTVKNIFVSIAHVGILFSQVGLHIMWLGEESDFSSGWITEGNSQSGNRSSILAFMKSPIDDDDLVNYTSRLDGWNTYRSKINGELKINDLRNWGRDSETMSGLLDNNKSTRILRCDARSWTLTVTDASGNLCACSCIT